MKEFNIVKDIVTIISKNKELVLFNKENACVGTRHALYFLSKESYVLDFENVNIAKEFSVSNMEKDFINYDDVTLTGYKKLDGKEVATFSNDAWVDVKLFKKYLDKYDTMTYKGKNSKSPILVYNKREELKMIVLPIAHK